MPRRIILDNQQQMNIKSEKNFGKHAKKMSETGSGNMNQRKNFATSVCVVKTIRPWYAQRKTACPPGLMIYSPSWPSLLIHVKIFGGIV